MEASEPSRASDGTESAGDVMKLADAALARGEYRGAQGWFRRLLALGQQSADKQMMARAYDRLGSLFASLGEQVIAIDNHLHALSLFEELEELRSVAGAQHAIGMLYASCNDLETASEYLARALEIFHDIGDRYNEVRALANIGAIHASSGALPLALDCELRVLAVYQAIGTPVEIATALLNVGDIYARMGRRDVALYHQLQAIERLAGQPPGELIVRVYLSVGTSYRENGDAADARFILQQGLEIARAIDHRGVEYLMHEELAQVLELLGDFRGALEHHRAYVRLLQEQSGQEKQKAITELRLRFDLERALKEEEIRRRDEVVHAVVRAQEEERRAIASDLHDGVGALLATARVNMLRMEGGAAGLNEDHRSALERSMIALDDATRELRTIAHSLATTTLRELGLVIALREMLDAVKTHDGVRFDLNVHGVDGRLPDHIETVIYRIAQELMANILKHAHARRSTMHLVRHPEIIVLMVEDDGVGFEPARARSGMGRENIAIRARTVNGLVRFDSRPGHGTTVTIEIPIEP